jgi:hypothetical protein
MNYQTQLRKVEKSVKPLLAALLWSAVLLGGATGCSAVRNYSVTSYQGPIPLEDTRYLGQGPRSTPAYTR